jgi:hypothetical protein
MKSGGSWNHRDTLIAASILPAIYLMLAIMTIGECTYGGTAYLQWYSAEIVTLPLSAVAEIFFPNYFYGPIGFLVLAMLNGGGMFLASYVAIRVWINRHAAGWSLARSKKTSAILLICAAVLWTIQSPIVATLNARCGPIIAMPFFAFCAISCVVLIGAAIRLWP